jgi:HAD superfamily hydrolase (TIGR01509 family)
MQYFQRFDPAPIEVLLCDADGNLFPSEEPAFDASVGVTNRFLQRFGLPAERTATELRQQTTGKNFRTTAVDLAVEGGVPIEATLAVGRSRAIAASADDIDSRRALTSAELEDWVAEERQVVTSHLGATLRPDPGVFGPLEVLSRRFRLAAVSSSASARLTACFRATELDLLMPSDVRFSAEDSLPVPTSKPDPAVYTFAGAVLGINGNQGLAVEDAVPGVASAVAAGFVTFGNVVFVPPGERARRVHDLRQAGASAVIESWHDLEELLTSMVPIGQD